MKPFTPFLLIFTLHLAFILVGNDQWAAITKPLLMVSLLVTVLWQLKQNGRLKTLSMGGLLLSLAGDTLLIFQQQANMFFMLGLVAFLLAHVCYIFLFTGMRRQAGIRDPFQKISFMLVAVYAAGLLGLLFPKLGGMAAPVVVYALTISIMLLAALHAVAPGTGGLRWAGVAGAVMFVLSDSLLAINKFHTPFQHAGFFIMLTYGLAQLLIAWWAVTNLKPVTS
jgi:uncharacterized membrane protein YhhN